MKPVLIELFGWRFFSYGTAIFASTLVCALLAAWKRPKDLLSLNQLLDICLLTASGALLGARFSYLVLHDDLTWDHLSNALRFWEKDSVSSIGIPVVAVPLLLFYLRWQSLPTARVLDYLVPFAVLGAAIQRTFGCFLAGCCAGKPTDLPWGLRFPDSLQPLPVHPTQLYLGLLFFLLAGFLYFWQSGIPGVKSWTGAAVFALINAVIAPFRDDWQGLGALSFSLGQIVYLASGIACFAAALILFIVKSSRPGKGSLGDFVEESP